MKNRCFVTIMKIVSIFLFLEIYTSIIFVSTIESSQVRESISMNILYNIYVFFELVYAMPLILTSVMLKSNFQILNDCLRDTFLGDRISTGKQVIPKESEYITVTVAKIYEVLSDALDLVNSNFTFQV
jgi:hypothetical protein